MFSPSAMSKKTLQWMGLLRHRSPLLSLRLSDYRASINSGNETFTLAYSSNQPHHFLPCARIYLVAMDPLLGNILYSMTSGTYLVFFSHVLLAVLLPLVLSLDIEIDNHCNETLWPALTGQPGDLPLPPALNYKGVLNLYLTTGVEESGQNPIAVKMELIA